jgi:hypothetical protein
MRSTSLAAATTLAVVFGGACLTDAVVAQENVTIDAQKCQRLKTPEERLACYESQVDAASAHKQAAAPPAPAPTPTGPAAPDAARAATPAPAPAAALAPAATAAPGAAATPTAAAAAAAAASAASASAAPANVADAPKPAQDPPAKSSATGGTTAPQEVVGTVAALSTTVPNAWLITLDNGQVWRQTYPEAYPLRPGQQVTLRPSKWGGAFRLTAERANGFIQVERVR